MISFKILYNLKCKINNSCGEIYLKIMIKLTEAREDKFYYSNLYKDYIYNFPKVRRYYQYNYQKIESYQKRIQDIKDNYDQKLRLKLSNILRFYNESLRCSSKTIENIESLKNGDAYVVVGGQQPGLLTGPIFIIYKILTVLKLSSFLEEELKVKAIPCFWNASDDSNLVQVNNLSIINNALVKIFLDSSTVNKGARFSDILLSADIFKELINKLEIFLNPSDFKPKIISFLNSCLHEGDGSFENDVISISFFFSCIISKLFSKYGLVVIDPECCKLKKLSYALLMSDLEDYGKKNKIISARGNELKKDGYHAQINSGNNALNFFWSIDGVRKRVTAGREGYFKLGNKTIKKEELASYLKDEINNASLNIVLRPLLQDSILPVIASVGGPGEVSYFAQLKGVYNLYGIKLPPIYPRFSATVMEYKTIKALGRLNMKKEDMVIDKDIIIKRVLYGKSDLNFSKMIIDFEKDVMVRLGELEKSIANLEIDTGSSFDRIKKNIKKEMKVLEKKITAGYKKKNNYIMAMVDKIYLNLFPDGNMQERELNIFNYLNKYDFSFIDKLYVKLKPLDFSHKFIEIYKNK